MMICYLKSWFHIKVICRLILFWKLLQIWENMVCYALTFLWIFCNPLTELKLCYMCWFTKNSNRMHLYSCLENGYHLKWIAFGSSSYISPLGYKICLRVWKETHWMKGAHQSPALMNGLTVRKVSCDMKS